MKIYFYWMESIGQYDVCVCVCVCVCGGGGGGGVGVYVKYVD